MHIMMLLATGDSFNYNTDVQIRAISINKLKYDFEDLFVIFFDLVQYAKIQLTFRSIFFLHALNC